MSTKIIITGSAGFIASHFISFLLQNTDYEIIMIDKLSYASKGLERVRNIVLPNYSGRIKLFTYDLTIPISEGIKVEIGNDVKYIVHMAAETHVEHSIRDPVPFVMNNLLSTINILEFARTLPKLEKFINFSTDEVYGTASTVPFKETDRHNPTNPYSASKSACEQLAKSYYHCYKLPLVTINMMNAFGPMQFVEKFIPKVIQYTLSGKTLNIHTDEHLMPGSRFYIHCKDIASATYFILGNGEIGETYNVPGVVEKNNLELAQMIYNIIVKLEPQSCLLSLKYNLIKADEDRPNHDIRYWLDGEKIRKLGWNHDLDFEKSLEDTVTWYLENRKWLE